MAEAACFPSLAQPYFVKGPEQTTARLADFLTRAMKAGRLRQNDPRFSTEMLLGMPAFKLDFRDRVIELQWPGHSTR